MSRGFTVIEVIVVVVLLAFAAVVFFVQKESVATAARDEQRKTAINAVYYSLEEVYFEENGYYPRTIEDTTLRSVDPELLKDPSGVMIGDADSDYRYEATDCIDNKCASYTLRTTLENEADYIKSERASDS